MYLVMITNYESCIFTFCFIYFDSYKFYFKDRKWKDIQIQL